MKIDKKQGEIKKDKTIKAKKTKVQTIEGLVEANPHFQFIGSGKIRCKLTNHEMLGTIENYHSYIKSKSYRRGLQSQIDLGEYNQILIDHKDNANFYYCQLTGAKIAKKKSVVDKHISGKKFKRAFQEFSKMQDEEASQEDEEEGEQEDEGQEISGKENQQQQEEQDENQKGQQELQKKEKLPEKKSSKVDSQGRQPKKNKKIQKDRKSRKDKKNGKNQSKKVVKK